MNSDFRQDMCRIALVPIPMTIERSALASERRIRSKGCIYRGATQDKMNTPISALRISRWPFRVQAQKTPINSSTPREIEVEI